MTQPLEHVNANRMTGGGVAISGSPSLNISLERHVHGVEIAGNLCLDQ